MSKQNKGNRQEPPPRDGNVVPPGANPRDRGDHREDRDNRGNRILESD